MNPENNSRDVLVAIAQTLDRSIRTLLEHLFGPSLNESRLGSLTLADLGVVLGFIAIAAAVNGLTAWLLRRYLKPSSREPAEHRQRILQALGRPIYLLIWICGCYFAAIPFLLGAPETPNSGIRHRVDQLFDLALIASVAWLAWRAVLPLDHYLQAWSKRSQNKLDDLLAPLITRSLRILIPLISGVVALPVLGFATTSETLLGKADSLLVIGGVAWILFQAVNSVERYVLSRYDIKQSDNLQARKVYTQVHVLSKTAHALIILFALASALMLFEDVRRFGTSILASAGVVGIIVGFAAQRTIANLFAGFQLAMTQPIRLDDVVIVENEWGRIEEITLTYVVVRIWDERRLIVPLSHFIERPFQNWTRTSAELLGVVTVWTDYSLPVAELRPAVGRIVASCKDWDQRFWNLQITDATDRAMQVRVLATSADASKGWDLRCEIREKLIDYLQQHHPASLPQTRANLLHKSGALA